MTSTFYSSFTNVNGSISTDYYTNYSTTYGSPLAYDEPTGNVSMGDVSTITGFVTAPQSIAFSYAEKTLKNPGKAIKVGGRIGKGLGVAGGVVSVVYSLNDIRTESNEWQNFGAVNTYTYLDFGVAATSFGATLFLASNPVGWGIAAGTSVYFLIRMSQEMYQESVQPPSNWRKD